MKRFFLSLFAILLTLMAWADTVTVQQALQKAQTFMQQREDAGSRPKRVKGTVAPQLTMARQFSGLYLFNVADNGGFVVVSNDDRTVPILGFSDSGVIDPDNMPDNMRAWLQGYADEIAWATEHSAKSKIAARAPSAQTLRRSHATTSIAPLVTSRWNQGTPYNNLCPEYSSGNRAVTGCVATAMAQVMYYHKWPQSATATIPAYKTSRYGINVPSLPATTFDWANMLDEYSYHWNGNCFVKIADPTEAQATAVATLMQYCGSSVQMDYGPESGSNSYMVANALKNYFDYNTTTTQVVSRDYYNAAKWADLIYHELANGRPVVYGGQSTGGGHEFVCDGYKYESSTDFFHINWGWGGISDDYFVLSALDPDAQGIGGSTSTDGYHFGQNAVIGVQKSTENGAVADVAPNDVNLRVNSMTLSTESPLRYMPMSMTLNITNNSSDDYDGSIYLGRYDDGYNIFAGNYHSNIPAGATRDIVIPFIPEESSYTILPFDCTNYAISGSTPVSFTVTEASRNEFVPIYGYGCDNLVRSQFIIPKTDLEDMAHSILNSVTFYASTLSAISWGAAQFDVYLKEVSETTLSSLQSWNTMEKVYSGSLAVGSDGKVVITFSEPFLYQGDNLLVGINQTQSGKNAGVYWVGTTASAASLGGYNTNISKQDFLPATTFDYTPGEAPSIQRPKSVIVNYTGGRTAEVSWTSSESAFDISVNDIVTENVTNPYTLENLELATYYTVKVRAKNGSDVSIWSSPATFTTDLAEEMCQITFKLTDSYGDGWNDAAIQVVDVLSGIEIGTVTNTNVAGAGEAQTYVMAVPNNRDIKFVWISGKYDSECSYVVYDVNGTVIFSGSGTMASPFTYYVSCSSVPPPTNITVMPSSTLAIIKWTGSGDSYNLRYKTIKSISYDFESADPWTVDDFAPFTTYDGDGLNTYNISGSSFTNQQYTGSVIAFQNGLAGSFTAHSGNAFGCFMDAIPNGDKTNNNDWFITPEIQITEGMVFSFWARSVNDTYGLERFKVGVYGNADGTFASYLEGSASEYAEAPVTWTQYSYDLSAYVGQTIKLAINCVSADAFAFCIDDIYIGDPNNDCLEGTISNVTTPYVFKGLTPSTTYEVLVQAETAGETSVWSSSVTFTTTDASFILGDANGDDKVDITDAISILNYLTGNSPADFNAAAADVTGDGEITIADAVGVMIIIMNP